MTIRVNLHTASDVPISARLSHSPLPYATLDVGDVTMFFHDPAVLQEISDAAHLAANALRAANETPVTSGDVWPVRTGEEVGK